MSIILHLDDPLDAIAVHCWNGTWGLISPGLFSAEDLINNAYGNIPTTTNPRTHYGCFLGGDGNLLAAQLVDVLFIAGAQSLAFMTRTKWRARGTASSSTLKAR